MQSLAPTLPDLIGLVGVALILVAYAGVQSGRLPAEDWRFSALNGVGAALERGGADVTRPALERTRQCAIRPA